VENAMPKRRGNREVLQIGGLLLALGVSGAATSAADGPNGEATTPSSARVVLARQNPPETEADPCAVLPPEDATPAVERKPDPAPAAGDAAITVPRRGEPDRSPGTVNTPLPVSTRRVPWYRHGVVALAAVLGVIFGLLWLLRRYVPSMGKTAGGPMRVVARTAISPKQSVALLEVGRRYVLVGITADRLTNLGHIQDPDESFHVRTQTAASRPGGRTNRFDELLSHEAAEYAEVESTPPAGPVNPGQLQDTMGQLRTLLGRLRTLQEPPAQ
jgi:flagellar biosynthetic protein FliO